MKSSVNQKKKSMIERIVERLFVSELCGQREKAEELKAAIGMKEKQPERKTYDDPDLLKFFLKKI